MSAGRRLARRPKHSPIDPVTWHHTVTAVLMFAAAVLYLITKACY